MDALFVENSKNTACPEVFGMSNMRKCAKCRVYQIFRCTRSSSCVRERDDGGYNKEPPKIAEAISKAPSLCLVLLGKV